MTLKPLSPEDMRAAQIFTGLTMAALVSTGFWPARWRSMAGIVLTVVYVAGAAGFLIHAIAR